MNKKWSRFTSKLYDISEYITISLKFTHQTKIYPLFVKHHWCTFYDWKTETEKEGWYVLDRHGKMIPWVHFDKGCLICLYSDMITTIEK